MPVSWGYATEHVRSSQAVPIDVGVAAVEFRTGTNGAMSDWSQHEEVQMRQTNLLPRGAASATTAQCRAPPTPSFKLLFPIVVAAPFEASDGGGPSACSRNKHKTKPTASHGALR
jgi:hypothetical protein